MHLATLWEAMADAVPESLALVDDHDRRTWREFDDRSARIASVLLDGGVTPGSTVAIDLYNCNAYLEVYLAVLKIRAVPANVNYRYLDDELRHILADSDARALVVHASLSDRVAHAVATLDDLRFVATVPEPDGGDVIGIDLEEALGAADPAPRCHRPDEDVCLSYTGGTTGLPKGVLYQMGALTNNALGARPLILGVDGKWDGDPVDAALDLRDRGLAPVGLPASPLMHSTGLVYASQPALSAGGCVVTVTGHRFDPEAVLAAVEREAVTVLGIVGDAIARPLTRVLRERRDAGDPIDVASLRTMCSAGVAWSAEVKDELFEYAPQVVLVDAAGTSEGGWIGSRVTRFGEQTSTSRFEAAPATKVLGEDGTVLAADDETPGLIACPTIALGYYNDADKTQANFRTIDGVLHIVPGDWGIRHPDGTITLLGRGSATINTGGEKVHPEEVEEAIKSGGGVEDVVVVGTPHERWGQCVTAVVQLTRPGARSDAEIADAVRSRLAPYKVPRVVVFVDEVPRFPNGKPDYERVKERAMASVGGS